MVESANRWAGLDHIRALAAFMVFTWHFTHGMNASPVPLDGAPSLPFAALFDEGHVGVSLFMCLSGYLFAALLEGKKINFLRFLIARSIRLFPLLMLLFAIDFIFLLLAKGSVADFFKTFLSGFVLPRWPSGRWSIAVELQFYLLLPFLLRARDKSKWAMPAMLVGMLIVRSILFVRFGTIEHWSYNTLVGRIDQFILGITLFDYRNSFKGKHVIAGLTAGLLAIGYYLFDYAGGFYQFEGWPSRSPLWIWWPTFEAITFSILIAYYDTSFKPAGLISDFISKIGFYSYGIYLIHFYFVFYIARMIDEKLLPISNFYIAWAFTVPVFLFMLIPSWLAYHIVEKPFQRFKPRYVVNGVGKNQPNDGQVVISVATIQ